VRRLSQTLEDNTRGGFMRDVGTVVWKELREMRAPQSGQRWGRGGWSSPIIFVLVFGIFMPWQIGADWVESPLVIVYWAWVPMVLVSGVVAQTFAGERERHTLEALLATRLPDGAILAGKITAVVTYGWAVTVAAALLGVITTNILHWEGVLLFYSAGVLLAILLITLLVALLGTAVGVLVSLRASTVRQAQQTLGIASMVLVFAAVYGVQALPIDLEAVVVQGSGQLMKQLVVGGGLAMAVLDAVLIALSAQRFQRAKLILD